MTDNEIIEGLKARDNRITEQFFYVKCRPLLMTVMRLVFRHPVDYDEMVSELYDYLMADDCAKLRSFQFRSSIYQWLKVVAIRHFIHKRDLLINDACIEPHHEIQEEEAMVDTATAVGQKIDITQMLALMDNRRYADTIRHLILQDIAPEEYAESIGVTVANLYNIKRRAIAALSRIAIKYYSYG